MAKIDEIDLGELISIKETLCASLSEDQKIDGIYRKLENLVVMLSQFYFETDQFRQDTDKLVWFGGEEGEFRVAIGGDGAPFGKWDESMSLLVSFLNVGPRVASPNDNFLLFGANCKESHEVVALYTRQLKAEIEEIEKKCYMVAGKKATFKFDLVPSDMKFLAFVNGELNNAAKYFSSFATVSKDDCKELQWKFGTSADCHWKPWQYEDRIAVAKLIADKKNKLPAKLSKKTQRDRITKFIADQHSRQEFPPLIGRLCDKELVEPLHLRNNAVQHLHTMLLKLALTVSNLPAKLDSTSDISLNSAMGRYLVALENEVKAGRLKKQLVKWLLEDRSKDKDFSYRLTGKDSRLILHKFMHLVNATRGTSNNPSLIFQLLVIVFIAIKLRDCTAIFSRYHLPEAKLKELPSLARDYFTAVALFSNSVSVTTWSIGHLVPAHTRQVFDKYGTGLGINTMQGREAKHVQIASYAKQSLFKRRWLQVFKHDFISKLWLPCQQPSLLVYHPAKESLLPAQIFKDPQHYCYCGFAKEAVNAKCFYCGHVLMAEIKQSVAEGKLTKRCLSVVVS